MKIHIRKFMRVITYRTTVKDSKSIFHQHDDIRFGKFTFGVNHGGGGALQSLHNIKSQTHNISKC